ncbi:MAG TPA: sodium ion-translocating decarboxylase subunit beta [Candidatus Limiplasma merdipullorum]|nr:sodium ion-translocating decarboxylase subunit beta [Clostridiales bacterium]HIR81712.1 sodium ion-translocating decarboxylase subunit beta [Candidatus Limiplasma merdipullorum]
MNVGESLIKLCQDSGIYALFSDPKPLIMIAIACVLMYLAVVKKYEPLLLMPIAFGMLLTNLPIAGMYNQELFAGGHTNWSLFGGAVLLDSSALTNPVAYTFTAQGAVMDAAGNMLGQIVDAITAGGAFNAAGALVAADGSILANSAQIIISSAGAYLADGQVFTVSGQLLATAGKVITPGMLDYLYLGVKLGIYPCLIFLGVGCMTDFGPLIANPKSLLLGAAAQLGIFITFIVCNTVMGFTPQEAASTGIIGGADGPTAIYLTGKLAPHLLGPIAVAAYSYMALVPVIQPPIMRALTTKKEREIVMEQLRPVSKREKIIFPIAVTIIVSLLLPSAAPLVGCLMLGNLFRESGVVDRLNKTAQNELMNIVTIFLGTTVGATATASTFLSSKTLGIIVVGVLAFGFGTAGGVLLAKLMNKLSGGKINPLIGSAGVSAVPMAARVSQVEGQKANPGNFLLMHAMGPNVAGVIGSAIAAGILLSMFG